MFKRIYTLFITGTLLSFQPVIAAHTSSNNIQNIIEKNGKIIVTIRENGKNKEIILSKDDLEKLKTKKSKQEQKIVSKKKNSKKNSKKVIKPVVKGKGAYVVKTGDTLFSIASRYKVSISDLVQLNKLKEEALIHPGDIIKIPKSGYEEAAKKAVAKNKNTVYTVKKGDTIYSIVKKYKMKITTFRKLNNLIRHPKLKPGMELTVIGTPALIKKRKIATKYVIKRGDTIWKIARKYNLTISQIKLLNPKIRTRSLRSGTVLNISKKKVVVLSISVKKTKKTKKLSGVLARYHRRSDSRVSGGSGGSVVSYAKRFLGTRYVWGASRPGAFDCSGFTQYVMKKVKGHVIPRVSRRQAYYGRYITRRNLRAGDLIFFDTSKRRRGYVNHVAIYIGNNKFIHASSAKHRVTITSLNKAFYRQRFMWGRRVN